jgi:hypothetical protein
MIVLKILCNGCSRLGSESRDVKHEPGHILRRILDGHGWRTGVVGPRSWTAGGKDYCPLCLAAAKRGEPVT